MGFGKWCSNLFWNFWMEACQSSSDPSQGIPGFGFMLRQTAILAYLLVEPFKNFALKGLGKTLKQRSNMQKACPIGQRSCKSQLPQPKKLLPRAIGQAIHRSLHRFMCTFIHSYAHVFSVCTVIMIGDSHFPFHSQIVKGTSRGGGPVVKVMFFDKLKEELFLILNKLLHSQEPCRKVQRLEKNGIQASKNRTYKDVKRRNSSDVSRTCRDVSRTYRALKGLGKTLKQRSNMQKSLPDRAEILQITIAPTKKNYCPVLSDRRFIGACTDLCVHSIIHMHMYFLYVQW